MVENAPLWTPSMERDRIGADDGVHGGRFGARRKSALDLCRASPLVGRRPRKGSGAWFGISAASSATRAARLLADGDRMPGAAFFPDARLNFAENLLASQGPRDAIVFRGEDKVERRLSWDELHALVSRLQQLFVSLGVKPGDRIAAMMPNMPETVAAMLAAASIGAVWSSCSPDFGEQGVLDRFGQIEPVVFIAPDGYWYNGKQNDVTSKVQAVMAKLPTLRQTLIVDYLGTAAQAVTAMDGAETLEQALAPFEAKPVTFERLPFAHPLYILFSSGTTGIPKCIVHSAGGTLHPASQGTASACRPRRGRPLLLFHHLRLDDVELAGLGPRLRRHAAALRRLALPSERQRPVRFRRCRAHDLFRHLGQIHRLGAQGRVCAPIDTHDLSSVRTISSTGSPLSPEDFAFVYDGIKKDVHLASISGGTDIVSCFVLGVPTEPVWSGEIQGPGLGMAVDVWDDDGRHLRAAARANWSAPRRFRPCRSASGTTPTAANITPPISSASTTSGAMATSPNGPNMAA